MPSALRRPSPALVVALVALFAGLCGSVYAAGGKHKISGKTIKAKSMPGNRIMPNSLAGNRIKAKTLVGNRLRADTVTGTQVNESTLARVPLAERAAGAETAKLADNATNALNAADALSAANADKVDGHDAVCAPGTQLFLGDCWESAPRPAATVGAAAAACATLGATLAGTHELVAFSNVVQLGNTDEWSDDINTVTAADTYTAVTVSKAGVVNFTDSTDAKEYRCVFPLLR